MNSSTGLDEESVDAYSKIFICQLQKPPKTKRVDIDMSKINAIGGEDVHRITSGQVVIDLTTALKELIDNSIDANAHHIEVVLKNYGIESIECSDDGEGIAKDNYESLALKHYTSKISTFQDVASVSTLGFRGEALASLCALAKVIVTTTTRPPRADKLEYNSDGKLISKSTTSRNKGTTVHLSGLFNNLPVRKKEFSKNCKRQFGKCLTMLQSYSVIQENTKFSVWHIASNGRKTLALSNTRNQGIAKKILSVFGSSSMRGLSEINLTLDLNPFKGQILKKYADDPDFEALDYKIQVKGLISQNSFGCGRAAKDRQLIYINKRPVEYPSIAQCCNEVYKSFNNVQYPAFFLNFQLHPQLIDINVTPDKRTVLLHNERYVIDVLKEALVNYYDAQDLVLPKSPFSQAELPNPRKRQAKEEDEETKEKDEEKEVQDTVKLDRYPKRQNIKVSNGSSFGADGNLSSTEDSRQFGMDSELTSMVEPTTEMGNSNGLHIDLNSEANEDENNLQQSSPPTERDSSQLTENQTTNLLNKFANFSSESGSPKGNCEDGNGVRNPLHNYTDSSLHKTGAENHRSPPLKNKSLQQFINPLQHETSLQRDGNESEKETGGNQTDPVVVEIDDTKVEHQVTFTQDNKLVFLSDEQPESCCDHHHSPPAEEKDSEYASMEPMEMNVRIPLPPQNCYKFAGHTYRSLTHDGGDNESQLKSISLKCKVDSMNFQTANQIRQKVERRHQMSFSRNVNLDNVKEGENYLTLTVKKQDFENMQIVGQFNLGFIICTRRTGGNYDLFIVDQHASDEKYNFETLQKNMVFRSQRLVAPLTVDLSAIDELAVIDNLTVFEKNGFKVSITEDELRGTKIKLLSLPVSKRTLFSVEDFYELVHLVKENRGINRDSIKCSRIRSMLAMRACRSSIMIGKPLTHKTMCKVVCHLGGLDKPWNCPHGRPTMRHLMELKDWNFFHEDYDI